MITLKAALVGTSCIGVLAVGGVTYATVAQPGALRSDAAKVPAAKPPAVPAPAAPAVPTCLPKPGDVKHAVPQQPGVPQGAVPNAGVPQGAVPQGAVPNAGAAQQKVDGAKQTVEQHADGAKQAVEQQAHKATGKVPADVPHSVPTCLPADKLPAKPEVPAKPDLPKVPHLPKVSCDAVKPAIPLGGAAEKSIILQRGLSHGTKHVGVITHKARKLCKVTEKWTGAAGQWLKVERIKAPQPYSLDQLQQALQLPAGGVPTTVGGVRGVQTPLGGAVLWYSAEDGIATLVEGSPAYTTQLQDVAAKLQQQAQQVR